MAVISETSSDRDHFAMRRRVTIGSSEIAPTRDYRAVALDHRSERQVGLPVGCDLLQIIVISISNRGEDRMQRSPKGGRIGMITSIGRCAVLASTFAATIAAGHAAGDLSRQEPVVITVELGKPGQHAFLPNKLRFETGKLYKLVLKNPSDDPHYFTSHGFTQLIYTRKVQVVQERNGRMITLAEFKGAIREIEVYPGQIAEWWFVPVASGRVSDLRCGIVGKDGKTHAEHGMVGEIDIE
jgi:uncharacterized cupredoxin-like copper-binding protein